MNLGEFRNRLKQLKAYKAELERRLKRSPMRAGDNIDWMELINEQLGQTAGPTSMHTGVVFKPSKLDGYYTKIKTMPDDEFYAFCQDLEKKGRFDLLQQVRAIRFNSAGW